MLNHSYKYVDGVLRMHIVVLLVKERHPKLLVGHNIVVQCTIFALALRTGDFDTRLCSATLVGTPNDCV